MENSMKSKVINLYSGPGAGKSTTAAATFAALKKNGVNAELVTEYAKGWAWQQRKIGQLDQFYLFAKQLHRECQLYGKVDVIVTDSPIGIAAYYAHKYCPADIAEALRVSHAAVRNQHHAHYIDIVLERTKAYNPKGRYETEEQARAIDGEMREFLTNKLAIDYVVRGTDGDLQLITDLVEDK
jgi:septum formation inhibitor-activating ATPase MinD